MGLNFLYAATGKFFFYLGHGSPSDLGNFEKGWQDLHCRLLSRGFFFFFGGGEPQALLAVSSPQEPGLLGFPEF